MLQEDSLATAMFNIRKKFGEVWPCGFWDMWADRQTCSSQYAASISGQSNDGDNADKDDCDNGDKS